MSIPIVLSQLCNCQIPKGFDALPVQVRALRSAAFLHCQNAGLLKRQKDRQLRKLRSFHIQGHQKEPSDKGVEEEAKEQGRDEADVGSPNVVDASKD